MVAWRESAGKKVRCRCIKQSAKLKKALAHTIATIHLQQSASAQLVLLLERLKYISQPLQTQAVHIWVGVAESVHMLLILQLPAVCQLEHLPDVLLAQ